MKQLPLLKESCVCQFTTVSICVISAYVLLPISYTELLHFAFTTQSDLSRNPDSNQKLALYKSFTYLLAYLILKKSVRRFFECTVAVKNWCIDIGPRVSAWESAMSRQTTTYRKGFQ